MCTSRSKVLLVPAQCFLRVCVSVFTFSPSKSLWPPTSLRYEPSVTAVRYGRVPKRSRERGGEESTAPPARVSSSDAEQSDAETKQLAVYDIILTVSQAFHANCGYTEEQTRGLVRKPLQVTPVSTERPVCCGMVYFAGKVLRHALG